MDAAQTTGTASSSLALTSWPLSTWLGSELPQR